MGSTIGLYKTELIKPRRSWSPLSQAESATVEWIDWVDWDNHRRLHGETGHAPPVESPLNRTGGLKRHAGEAQPPVLPL
ncbi:hypothetical protein ACFOOM_22580 [Streptomyces echinoruber]|uniref:Integrase catalytic domain-containing protein n=1 Tax=Streptomyces echinoruber TaxID=68898 RepID=A0A918R468_9ACTN|nr:hypothetical protein [Streptomyces echinoruber]GGZ82492.1 hypothetical protein GCM10010389_20590 [Streptomyces echinoruber]